MSNMKPNSIYIKDYNAEKLIAKISERDGLLIAQLYRFLDPETRPHYTTFLRQLYKIKGLRYTRVLSESKSVFVSVNHSNPEIKMKKMLLAAEWELKNERHASWFLKADELYKIYDLLGKKIPNIESELIHGKVKIDTFHSKLNDASVYVKYTSGRLKRIADIKRASDKIKKEELAALIDKDINLSLNMVSNEITIDNKEEEVIYLNHSFGVDEGEGLKAVEENSEAIKDKEKFDELSERDIPPITLLSLYTRGIYFTVGEIDKLGLPSSYIFHYFDAANNITKAKWKFNVSMVFDFMAWHGIDKPFLIKVHTWSDARRDVYKNSLQLDVLTLKYVKLIPQTKVEKSVKQCSVVEFDSLSADKMFNKGTNVDDFWVGKETLFEPKTHAPKSNDIQKEKEPKVAQNELEKEWDMR